MGLECNIPLLGEPEDGSDIELVKCYFCPEFNFTWQAECMQKIMSRVGQKIKVVSSFDSVMFYSLPWGVAFELICKGYNLNPDWIFSDFLKWKQFYYPVVLCGDKLIDICKFRVKLLKQYNLIVEKRYLRDHPWG